MALCAVPSVMAKDARFQALKESYKERHYSDDHLAQALQLCREYHDYDMDWYPETPAQRGVFTRFLNYYLTNAKLSRTSSDLSKDTVYNLYTTLYALYTPEQLENRINMLANDFSTMLDRIAKGDKYGRTRQELIKAQSNENQNGFVRIMKRVFDIYESHYTDVDKQMEAFEKRNPGATEDQKAAMRKTFEYRAQEYKTILANKERLAALAATRIGENEGFAVKINDLQVSFEEEDEPLKDGAEDANETTGEDKEEGTKGDRYADFRLTKLLNTLSIRARKLISKIEKTDENGKIIRDDLGVTQFIGTRQVAAILKRVLVDSTPESMKADLVAAADFYPWINSIVKRIEKNPDDKKTLFTNFKSAETTYVYVNFENGRYTPHLANSRSAGYSLMREAGDNLRAGYVLNNATSIYTGYGSLKSLEDIQAIREEFDKIKDLVQSDTGAMWIKMVDGDKAYAKGTFIDGVIEKAASEGKDVSYLTQPGPEAMEMFLANNPEVPAKISSFLRGMGFAISEKDVRAMALQTMQPKSFSFLAGFSRAKSSLKGRNKLYQLVEYMSGVYGRAEDIAKNSKVKTGQYLYNTSTGFMRINRALALTKYKDVEARVVNEGKSLSTYNHVNLLHQVFDGLMNKTGLSEKGYQDFLKDEYLQFEGMALGSGQYQQATGWLKQFASNERHIRENLRVIDLAAFNHVEYARLSREQKLTNSLVMFLETGDKLGDASYGAYEVPIQADYETAYNFIFAPIFGEAELTDELTNEVLIELERIAAIKARLGNENRTKLEVYEKQGLRLQIFPELNDTDFIEKYAAQPDAESARAFVHEQVAEQLNKVVAKDIKTINDAGILTNKALSKVDFGARNYDSLYSESGRVEDLSEKGQAIIRSYALNVFYARQQMAKLLVGGTEQFKGLIDYEKRNMLTHAPHSSLDTTATWNGIKVGKETQNVLYIEDDESESAFIDSIKDMLHQLLEEKLISKEQFDTMWKSYSGITTTDGQGFRTFESFREVMIMSDQWDNRHEEAYNNIMRGTPSKDDVQVFMQNIKPVLTGYETVPPAAGSNQKPIKLTVLHKYSEAVLLPMALAKYCLQTQSVPVQAMDRAQKKLKKQGKNVDLFLFHSGVKVGAHSVVQPFAKDSKGNRILKDADSIENYLVNRVNANSATIHTLPFKYYGIAAPTPVHIADDRIAWASQAEKVAWANVLKGQKITVRGRKMDAWDARELYFDIKTANIVDAYTEIRKFFTNTDELERVFQEELASKSYSSRELQYALAHLADGTFAVPLFSPNVEHQVQELLSSIIKKRLTKPKRKGANILQATGLGMDVEASAFDDKNALSEDEKLHVVFEGTGKNKHIKYVEVFIPIHDSRLKIFADKNGNIGPERLKELVASGIIPESMLEFIAYRTPSDAEHSVIPCRIKGFVANAGGATIMMPKEIMVMTGHDYDGDKMRCHFKDFRLVNKEGEELNLTDSDITQMILGQKPVDSGFKKVEVYEYDYDKSAIENSQKARDNARVELMFSELTSPDGSRRMLIPGGCEESKVIAKTLYLVRASKDKTVLKKISDELVKQRVDEETAYSAMKNSASLYNTLSKLSSKKLSDIVSVISSSETPFSATHAADAFDYIMGGAEMIGVYATYNSALQMLQRLDMSYVPKLSKKGKPYEVILFGHTFGKLFDVRNHEGQLESLGLARLLNAAVDNGKDPILGYLNQTKEMSELTFLMFAAGMTEEEIHLLMNQPAVIELINRLKLRTSRGIVAEAQDIIDELSANNQRLGDISDKAKGQWIALDVISGVPKDVFKMNLADSYADLKNSKSEDSFELQIAVLQTFIHLNTAAENLAEFVRLTRPESESGSIGTSVADIIAKKASLDKFRKNLANLDDSDIRISGMREVLAPRDVHEGWDTEYIEEILGLNLPEVVALNSLMLDSSLEMFKPFFPQAKRSWVDLAKEIAGAYSYNKIQEGIVEKIGQEMILWKLLSNKKFVQGDPQEEQRRILIDVPKNLKDLKERIARAQAEPGKDLAADELVGNAFLDKLTSTSPENSSVAPRLQFSLNGAAIEGTRDLISSSWGAMLASSDEKIKQLALDLFKYNLYTNGFSYGMYEFAHFAPFSILMSTPGYIDALRDTLNANWDDEIDRENFINYYYMNHWGDKKFIPHIGAGMFKFMKTPDGVTGQLWIQKDADPIPGWQNPVDIALEHKYIILTSDDGNGGKIQDLYRVLPPNGIADLVLVKAQKLGVRNRNQQVTLQYNPAVDYRFAKPVVPGNTSAWGQLDALNIWGAANINAGEQRPFNPNTFAAATQQGQVLGLGFFGLEESAKNIQKVEEKAEQVTKKNEEILSSTPSEENIPILPINDAFAGLGGEVDLAALQAAAVRTSSEDLDGKMLSIIHKDDSGEMSVEKVPASPANITEARRQKAFVELNKRLREILRDKGIAIGTLTDAEARLSIGGIADFDTANVTAEGLLELIRIAEGYEGEKALPEEFAHVALEMLGYDNVLVQRLLNALRNNREAMQEAYEGLYDEYEKRYGEDNMDKLVLEAAGKLIAKNLLRQQEIKTHPVRNLIHRIVDAIKSLFRRFRRDEIQNAIFDANDIASKIAREMLGGKLLDQMSLTNISASGQFLKVQQDLNGKNDILSKLLKTEVKRLSIFKKREGHDGKGRASAVIKATEAQIAKLESAIRNYKTEDAIVSYLNDSLEFLSATEKSLDDAVKSGRPVNSICRKLNTVRDTLYSFQKSISDIREAIVEKEVQDNVGLTSTLDTVSGVLAKFYDKYESLARTYFEEMLSSVYGEHGKTVTIGREKGRHISIHEMARKADRDIGLLPRWLHSLADCNDYVLRAIDSITRDAKLRARRRATSIRPQIEAAIADLYKATGSRDQSFMFEIERGEDGKMHRTGKYISKAASEKLAPAQKRFYDTMMEIKALADSCVPESLVQDVRQIVMMRKYTMDRFKDAEGAKDKALVAWEGLKNRVMDMSDDIDFDNYEVAVDFEGNKVDMLPVKFLMKGKNESFDDMTTDVATSMMAYAGMAFEYNELNGIIGILENAKYMASERDVAQRTGTRKQRESIGYKSNGEIDSESPAYFHEPFTRKQASTRIQDVLEDFFQMHIYGHVQKAEGNIGRTRISKRKLVDFINMITSYSQMAINLPQRIANINTGATQIMIESVGKGAFDAKDVAWASALYVKESGDRLAETGKTDYDNKLSLWNEYFDVQQNNGRYQVQYKNGRVSRIFNSSLLYAGLTMGEDYLSSMTSLALARRFKVKDAKGKTANLWDAYEVKYTDPENKTGAYLSLKSGYTKADGSPITFEDEAAFSKKVAGFNFELQGIYNLDDRSAIQQYAFGALVIMYRKWIAPALKRRYAGVNYNLLKDDYQEGYHTTMFRLVGDILRDTKSQVTEEKGALALINIVEDMKALRTSILLNWGKMTDYEKSNVARSFAEFAVIAGLWLATSLLGKIPPPDYGDDQPGKMLKWWDQTVFSQMLRLRTEIGSQAPTPMLVDEALHILKSPFAAIAPLQHTIDAFNLLIPSNYWTDIKSGRYKGHKRAYKYFRELPIISMFKKVDNFLDPSPMIQYYKNDIVL